MFIVKRVFTALRAPAILALLLGGVAGTVGARAQSLEEKLGAATDYVPRSPTPAGRLVEVAQKFKLPMAVEWVEGDAPAAEPEGRARARTVRELIDAAAGALPDHRVVVEGGLVRVYSQRAASHPFNFLNLRLERYAVTDGDLFDAEDRLRWAVRFTLEPEKYRRGFGGGYGHGSDEVFTFPKFSLSGAGLTVREVLDRIALAQGNAMWVASIREEDLGGGEPRWVREGADGGDKPVTSGWHFHPLAGVAELAEEQVAVDVEVEGLVDRRMSTVPVILGHGLVADHAGGTGISTSGGNSLVYGARVETKGRDAVAVSFNLMVRRRGEGEKKFEGVLEVVRGQVTELSLEPRVRVRAYLEPTHRAAK